MFESDARGNKFRARNSCRNGLPNRQLGIFALLACLTLLQACAPFYQSPPRAIAAPFRSGDQFVVRAEVYRAFNTQDLAYSRQGAAAEGWNAGVEDVWSNGCYGEACLFYPILGPITAAASGAVQATIGFANGVDATREEILQATSAIRRDFQPEQFQSDMQAEMTKRLAEQLGVEASHCGVDEEGGTRCRGSGRTGSIHTSFGYSLLPAKQAGVGQLDIVVSVSAAAEPTGMFKHSCATFEYRRPIGHLFEVSESSVLKEMVRSTVRDIAPVVAMALTSVNSKIDLSDAMMTAIRHRAADCVRNTEFALEMTSK